MPLDLAGVALMWLADEGCDAVYGRRSLKRTV